MMDSFVKVSLKVEYAGRVLAQLAGSAVPEEWVRIELLAAAEEIPANYLVQILNELRTSGLIRSRRGKQGGYALARAAGDITLLDVVRAVEGDPVESTAVTRGASGARVGAAFRSAAAAYAEALARVTLADLVAPRGGDHWEI